MQSKLNLSLGDPTMKRLRIYPICLLFTHMFCTQVSLRFFFSLDSSSLFLQAINYAIEIKLVPRGSDQEEVTNLRHMFVIHITYIYSYQTHVYLCQIATQDIPSCFSDFTIYYMLLSQILYEAQPNESKSEQGLHAIMNKCEEVLVPLTREESHNCTIYCGIIYKCTLP